MTSTLSDGRLVGFRLTGDVSGAGYLHSLVLRGTTVGARWDRVVEPGFGIAADLPAAAFARAN